jgi:hypothetical protein
VPVIRSITLSQFDNKQRRRQIPSELTKKIRSPKCEPANAMEREFGAELAKYRRSHDLFEAALCNIIVPWNRRAEFQSLLGDRGTTVDLDNYEQAARIAHRDRGWRPQRRLLELLVEIIRSRERVQEWYLRLPAWDARRAHAVSHHSVIELVKRTYAILNHGRPYEGFEGEHRPAVQAPQGQSLLPAVQRLPLLGMDQRMRADAAGKQRSGIYPSQTTMLIR